VARRTVWLAREDRTHWTSPQGPRPNAWLRPRWSPTAWWEAGCCCGPRMVTSPSACRRPEGTAGLGCSTGPAVAPVDAGFRGVLTAIAQVTSLLHTGGRSTQPLRCSRTPGARGSPAGSWTASASSVRITNLELSSTRLEVARRPRDEPKQASPTSSRAAASAAPSLPLWRPAPRASGPPWGSAAGAAAGQLDDTWRGRRGPMDANQTLAERFEELGSGCGAEGPIRRRGACPASTSTALSDRFASAGWLELMLTLAGSRPRSHREPAARRDLDSRAWS
jgi:hypothetical protein